MSLVPRWKNLFPSTPRRPSSFFNLGKFFEDIEQEVDTLGNYHSGLSISSDDKSIFIEAHVPGLTAKEVEVSIDNNNVLWIKGEKKVDLDDKKKKFYCQCQTQFSYCVPLWEEIDMSVEPEAICKDGVMRVICQKKKENQVASKKIRVRD